MVVYSFNDVRVNGENGRRYSFLWPLPINQTCADGIRTRVFCHVGMYVCLTLRVGARLALASIFDDESRLSVSSRPLPVMWLAVFISSSSASSLIAPILADGYLTQDGILVRRALESPINWML